MKKAHCVGCGEPYNLRRKTELGINFCLDCGNNVATNTQAQAQLHLCPHVRKHGLPHEEAQQVSTTANLAMKNNRNPFAQNSVRSVLQRSSIRRKVNK